MHRFVTRHHLILLLLVLTLQFVLSPFFYKGGRPDFFYLMVLDYAFFWQWEWIPLFALMIGLLRDFIGIHLFGIDTASFAFSGFLLYMAVQKLERENPWVRFFITLLFISLTETLSISLGRGLEASKGLSFDSIGSILWTIIYTTALAPGFFWFTGRWFKRSPFLKQYELFR